MTETEQQPVLRAKRRLPTGRAVLGGLLVTLAVLGVLFASRLGDDATFQQVVVANEDLAPGTVLEAQHLAEVTIRLTEDAVWVENDAAALYGSVVLGPVARLEFIQASNIAEGTPDGVPSGLAEVSIEIEPGRAPATLSPGELVSVVATFDDVEPATTRLIADRVVVLSFSGSDEFATNESVLRLGISDGAIASDIVTASITGDVSIIGITGAAGVVLPEAANQ